MTRPQPQLCGSCPYRAQKVSDAHSGLLHASTVDPIDRSDKAHNLLFAAVKRAYSQWPETHDFQPSSDQHLRGWLLVEVGHCISVDIDGPANITVATVRLVRQLLQDQGGSETALLAMRMYQTKSGVRIVVPKSIARSGAKRIGKTEFNQVAQKVYDIIEAVVGVSIKQLTTEHVA